MCGDRWCLLEPGDFARLKLSAGTFHCPCSRLTGPIDFIIHGHTGKGYLVELRDESDSEARLDVGLIEAREDSAGAGLIELSDSVVLRFIEKLVVWVDTVCAAV